MFKNKKNKEAVQVTTATTTTGSTTRTTEVRRSANAIEQRTVTHTTSRHLSITTSKRELESSVQTEFNGKLSTNLLHPNLSSNVNTGYQIDAKPFNIKSNELVKSSSTNSIGYQSPFSRKLKPYTSSAIDAKPFNPSQPSPNRLAAPSAFSRNEPAYASYQRPRNTSSPLFQSSSTQSLPSTNESTSHRNDPRIPTYNTNGKKRGKVLVINNINFLKELEDRKGAEMDEKNIKKLFTTMGFDVDVHRNLNQKVMLAKIKSFSNDTSLKKVDMSILIMMSHGNNIDNTGKVIRGGFTQIYGTDDKGLEIEDILNHFSAENCQGLIGKPKIFIFQCCRGERSETLHNDAVPIRNNLVKKHADMLIAFSTLPGFYSIRDTLQGSWYIQCICEVFQKYAKEYDVENLLKIVDEELSKKHPKYQQTSMYESRGFRRCYLNPK